MTISNYLKSRKYFLIIITIIIFLILIIIKPKNIKAKNNIFTNYLKTELSKKKLLLITTQNIKINYKFNYRKLFFIAEKNGLKDVFSAEIRTTNLGEIINLKNINQITKTPLSDESIIYSNNELFIYKNNFRNNLIINIIKKQKLVHLISKQKIDNIYYKKDFLIVDNHKYNINNLKTNKVFKVYKELLQINDTIYFNNLNKILKTNNWNNNYKYIQDSKISTNKKLPFKYLKIKIPKKNYFEIYFFNKKNYYLKVIDSGGVKYSKTGSFFKNNTYNKNNIFLDFSTKGGLQDKKNLIRPIITNYPTILINGKNNIAYGFLNKKSSEKNTLLQFNYPLIFKGKKNIEIENLKKNLTKSAKKNKLRTGICLKNNIIGYFQISGSRNLLIDYLYLIDCDYAVETNTQNISTKRIENNRPKLALIPKNQINLSSSFDKYKFLEKYEDKFIKIYKIPCGNLRLSYQLGKSDPIIAKKLDINNKIITNNSISSYLGAIDPINPDGLYSNNELYYNGKKEMKAFIINDLECKIGDNKKNTLFYKEGEVIFNDNKKLKIKNKKYQKILSAIGIKDNTVFIYEFKKPNNYTKLFSYNSKIKASTIIIFENYNGKLDKNSGKLIIQNLKNGKEIFPLEND